MDREYFALTCADWSVSNETKYRDFRCQRRYGFPPVGAPPPAPGESLADRQSLLRERRALKLEVWTRGCHREGPELRRLQPPRFPEAQAETTDCSTPHSEICSPKISPAAEHPRTFEPGCASLRLGSALLVSRIFLSPNTNNTWGDSRICPAPQPDSAFQTRVAERMPSILA